MLWSAQLCKEPHSCLKRPIKRRGREERRVLITPEKLRVRVQGVASNWMLKAAELTVRVCRLEDGV